VSKHGTGVAFFELRARAPALELHRPTPGGDDPTELEVIGRIEWSEIEGAPLFEPIEWVDAFTGFDIAAILEAMRLVDTREKFDRLVADRPALSVVR
jgi:hypothetical protein